MRCRLNTRSLWTCVLRPIYAKHGAKRIQALNKGKHTQQGVFPWCLGQVFPALWEMT